jgi:glycine cleavage system H protein
MHPNDRRYTREHEWAMKEDGSVRVGITDYAQDALGDIVYVDLPAPGTQVKAMQPFGEVESTKSVSDLYSPVSGVISERNTRLEDAPELINQDPHGDGWMVVIEMSEGSEYQSFLTAGDYQRFLETEAKPE